MLIEKHLFNYINTPAVILTFPKPTINHLVTSNIPLLLTTLPFHKFKNICAVTQCEAHRAWQPHFWSLQLLFYFTGFSQTKLLNCQIWEEESNPRSNPFWYKCNKSSLTVWFIQDAKNQLDHVPHLLHPHQRLRHSRKTNICTGAVKDPDLFNPLLSFLPVASSCHGHPAQLHHSKTV